VRGDHPDFGCANARIRERRFDRARQSVAVIADREQTLCVGCGPAAEHFAEDRRVALARRILRLERERSSTFAEEAPSRRASKGRIVSFASNPTS